MSFRLRRGTDTERQSVVFAEGELAYTTDTKELYVGDGTTLGGIKITGSVEVSPIALSRNLDLNTFDINGSGDIDISGTVTATSFYGSGAHLTNLPLLDVNNGASYQINIVGADSSVIVNSNTSELYGDFIGNIKGSVYDSTNNIMVDNSSRSLYGTLYGEVEGVIKGSFIGDDSTIMIDGATGAIHTSLIYSGINLVEIHPTSTNENKLQVSANDNRAIFSLVRQSNADISGTDLSYGAILFQRNDVNSFATTGVISGLRDSIILLADASGSFPESAAVTVFSGGDLGVGTYNPSEKLDVRGNAKVTGFVQFGSLTSTARDALTAANGMVIYNTTDNKFQGYQNGAWINLDDGTAA